MSSIANPVNVDSSLQQNTKQQQQSNTSSTTTPSVSNESQIPTTAAVATAAAAAVAVASELTSNEESIRNQKLVEEFQYLLEKSQSLFSGLRDLPPTGSHRQWRPYFEKTFEVYTKLWKFQQTHRSVLENKNNYGLKRWEVGEIASKIGQLYYHYYLRTSETNYLHEAYVFYEAIHERQYFKDILEVRNAALMVKKMRYYARFIIVCLLLNRNENIRLLISELEGLIEEYTKSYKPPDAKEWQRVLDEISNFSEAEKKLIPINLDRTPDKIDHRLPFHIPERNMGHTNIAKLKLQEAILVGNYQKQIKFSELTLDMYRMLQSLEREPSVLHPSAVQSSNNTNIEDQQHAKINSSNTLTKRMNPHKYLLYRPSLNQLLVYISTAFKDTSEHSALLLYVSADGCVYPDQVNSGYGGGVLTNNPKGKQLTNTERVMMATTSSIYTGNNNNAGTMVGNSVTSNTAAASSSASAAVSTTTATTTATTTTTTTTTTNNNNNNNNNMNNNNNNATITNATASNITGNTPTETLPPSVHCLHPADLIPFSRKPLFLIIDSDYSTQFKTMPTIFNQPLMCLMSPIEYPSSVQDKTEIGSLFTLFLHTPLLGFCSISDIGNLDQQKWDDCVKKLATMEKAIGDLLINDANVDVSVKRFMSDDFLYYFIVRFVLCGIFLRYHSSFKDERSYPSSLPSLPESIYSSPEIVTMLGDLTMIADVGTYFSLPAYAMNTTSSVTTNTSSLTSNNTNPSISGSNTTIIPPLVNNNLLDENSTN
ncbi:uncharacterized protein BX663DRAFT_565423 [Cokeromyces recurvatus]|uniref:uncharacterized protein n=1 Tax=Cokeromyces recurvatus TaxID=90255 RepID=UPI0022203403|nr:uncharacterized protein BX663DRAFT_565423 [Cokeromyces recurvatus]KAI7897571.1 hypothetical protein BX663DRAFT_565423 [Cokeromyces recurvatus]